MSLLLALTGAGGNSQALAITLDGVTVAISQTAGHSQALAATLDGVTALINQSVTGAGNSQALAITLDDVSVSITQAGSAVQPQYSGEFKVYIKRGKKYHIFNTQSEADAWEKAEEEANEAIEQAQKTSRRARKRFKERVYQALPESDVIDTGDLLKLANSFSVTIDMQSLIMSHNISQLMDIRDRLIQLQDEDDIEMLLLSLP